MTQEDLGNELVEDYYQLAEITVDGGQTPIRIDRFLMDRLEKATRNKIQNAIKKGLIRVNEKNVKANYKVRPKDHIRVLLENEPRGGGPVKPEPMDLNIVFEDDDILVIDKPAGLVVHPGVGNWSGTLVNGLVHYFDSKQLPVMVGNQPDRPGLVHRIDKDTSGLLVIAKTEEAISGLSKQFFDHTIDRSYLALVWGDVQDNKGTISGNIGRHPTKRMEMCVFDEDQGYGKHAVTHYEVVENLYYVTLVRCKLETGRTHQIRVHMKYIGHTLFNDQRYGGDRVLKGTVFSKYKQFVENTFDVMPRQALHAESLGFVHPVSGENMFFESPLPADFLAALERWRKYTSQRRHNEK